MPQGPLPATHFLTKAPSTEGSTALSNSATSQEQSVKTLDPMGTVYIQTKTGAPFFGMVLHIKPRTYKYQAKCSAELHSNYATSSKVSSGLCQTSFSPAAMSVLSPVSFKQNSSPFPSFNLQSLTALPWICSGFHSGILVSLPDLLRSNFQTEQSEIGCCVCPNNNTHSLLVPNRSLCDLTYLVTLGTAHFLHSVLITPAAFPVLQKSLLLNLLVNVSALALLQASVTAALSPSCHSI